MRKRVLLTGASGVVGFEVFKELLNRKDAYSIRVLNIDSKFERQLFQPYQQNIEIIWGDIRDAACVTKALKDVNAVVHAAGIIPPLADLNPKLACEVNVEGTKNIVEGIKAQPVPPNLLFTSSISVYGDRIEQPYIGVDDPLVPSDGDEYAQTKIEAENIIIASGIRYSIFRLCGILAKGFKIQPLMFHMPLNTSLEWCYPSDVGYALTQAIDEEGVINGVYNLGGGEECRIVARDFLQKMFAIWGLDASILPDYAFAVQNFHSGFYRDGYKLNRILGFRSKTLQDYLEMVRDKVSPNRRKLIRMVPRSIVRQVLLRMSEPLRAIRENDDLLIKRFYGSRNKFFEMANT